MASPNDEPPVSGRSSKTDVTSLCPRCGGAGKPPRRPVKNPFLRDQVTCVDCGLDFEPASAWPW